MGMKLASNDSFRAVEINYFILKHIKCYRAENEICFFVLTSYPVEAAVRTFQIFIEYAGEHFCIFFESFEVG